MEKLTEEHKSIIKRFQNNFDKLTFAQQCILKLILEKDNVEEFQDNASFKHGANYYGDCHSDYYDSY